MSTPPHDLAGDARVGVDLRRAVERDGGKMLPAGVMLEISVQHTGDTILARACGCLDPAPPRGVGSVRLQQGAAVRKQRGDV